MDPSLLTVAKSMYCLFKYAVYTSYLLLVIFFSCRLIREISTGGFLPTFFHLNW